MLLPPVRIKRSTGGRRLTRVLLRGAPAERLVNATAVVIDRNPKTGELVPVPEKFVPHFKAGRELRERVDSYWDMEWS